MGRLQGKVAIVTGGASGIGRGVVERFLQEGASVVVSDIQDDKGARLAADLGPSVAYEHADVGEERDVEALIAETLKRHGRLDCMVNNAGVGGPGGSIADTPTGVAEAAFRILFWGVVYGLKHAGSAMRAQKSGSIISTASVAGVAGSAGPHIYSAAKAAVIHLTQSVARELGESNVRVNCICPGGIATPLFGKAFGLETQSADQTVEILKAILARAQPIPRAGLPEDIANAALFLASDESTFVTGHALVVDGGMSSGLRWSEYAARIHVLEAALGAKG
jgi:NAD(P)-dependent dehydrogenase (short-subunit alcohol dehydrogenase family)